jgi:hypothetical protein
MKNAMPPGELGHMQVYRSGKIKLKIGDITYQVPLYSSLGLSFVH